MAYWFIGKLLPFVFRYNIYWLLPRLRVISVNWTKSESRPGLLVGSSERSFNGQLNLSAGCAAPRRRDCRCLPLSRDYGNYSGTNPRPAVKLARVGWVWPKSYPIKRTSSGLTLKTKYRFVKPLSENTRFNTFALFTLTAIIFVEKMVSLLFNFSSFLYILPFLFRD